MGARAASIWARIGGGLVVLLGLVHNLGVMEIYRDFGFDALPSLLGRGFVYMFLGVGLSWILDGALLFVSGLGLRRGASWAWPLGSATAGTMLVFGIGAMLVMPDNPPAIAILGCSIVASLPFVLHRPLRRLK